MAWPASRSRANDGALFWWNYTKGDRIPIYVLRDFAQILLASCFKSWSTFIHMMVQCALRCCATFIGTVLDKCLIEDIELLYFTIK